jgi:hypothetical protein
MASQKPLKTAIGLISLAYNQAVLPLNVAKGRFLRLRQLIEFLNYVIILVGSYYNFAIASQENQSNLC